MRHMPGEEAWLVGERRASGERKYYLSSPPPDANLKTLAAAIKARWVCEQAHQQLKEELGLDHFEGRSWHGLHRHTLMTMIAYAYLQSRRLAEASGGKRIPKGRPSRRCPRSGAPCSPFSLARRHIDVPIAKSPCLASEVDPDGIDQGNKLRTVAHALRQSMRHDDLLGPVDRRLRVVALDEAVLGQEPAAKLRCTLGSGSFEGGRGTGPQRLRFSALRFSSAVCWQKNPQKCH